MNAPSLQFLGAAGTVTGSKFLLDLGDHRVLFDCGLFQGLKEYRLRNWTPLPIEPSEIDAVVLTHAHLDHSGYLPRLIQQGFHGPVFCTPATSDLLRILLPDAGRLQEEEAEYANFRGYTKHRPALPLYTQEEALESIRFLQPLNYEEESEIADGVTLRYLESGHLLGSAFLAVNFRGLRLVLSGDIGGYDRAVMCDPTPIPSDTDYLVTESTYGDRADPHAPVEEQLKELLLPVLNRKGIVVIPAFAVGRTSLVLHYLSLLQESGGLPDVTVYVDSPMATDAVNLYSRDTTDPNVQEAPPEKPPFPLRPRKMQMTRSAAASKQLNHQRGPAIIISASGMATGGRVLHHLKRKLPDPRNLVLLAGYQAEGTRGRALQDGAREVKIHGERVPVAAQIATLHGLSAHGNRNDLIRWIGTARPKPKRTFLVHGEPTAIRALEETLTRELDFPCHAPSYLEEVSL